MLYKIEYTILFFSTVKFECHIKIVDDGGNLRGDSFSLLEVIFAN